MNMTKEALIKFISQDKDVMVDKPFNNPAHRNHIIFDALRHTKSKKIFALVYYSENNLYIDLKCEPSVRDELMETTPYITIGKHFDKQLWLTINLNLLDSKKVLFKLVNKSYHLTGGYEFGK